MDFCYVYLAGKTIALDKFLEDNNLSENRCGLVALTHFKDAYALHHDADETRAYKGIICEKSTNLRLSSVEKGEKDLTVLYYNQEGYSRHCKDYLQYTDWLKKTVIRNVTLILRAMGSKLMVKIYCIVSDCWTWL